jgi:hypothetical protein
MKPPIAAEVPAGVGRFVSIATGSVAAAESGDALARLVFGAAGRRAFEVLFAGKPPPRATVARQRLIIGQAERS